MSKEHNRCSELSLQNFVTFLIGLSPDDRFAYRREICDTVCNKFTKEKILDEIEKQASDFKNISEAVSLTTLVRDIR